MNIEAVGSLITFVQKNWRIAFKPVFYLLAVGLNRGMGFLLIPLLTHHLSPEEYGYLGLGAVLIGILRIFIGLNSPFFIIVKFSAFDKVEISKYIYHALMLVVMSLSFVLILLLVVSPFLFAQFKFSIGILIIIGFTAALMEIEAINLVVLQMQKKASQFFTFNLFSAVLQLLLVLITIVILGLSWKAKLIGDLIAVLFVCLALIVFIYRTGYIRPKNSLLKMKTLLRFSLPLLPHTLSLWGMTYLDRFFIAELVSIEAVGIYSVAYIIGMSLMLFYDSLQRTWQPYFFEALNSQNQAKKVNIIRFTWGYYLICIIIFMISVGVLNTIGPFFVSESYKSALELVPMIFLGYTFHGMYRAVAGYLYHVDKNSLLSAITGSAVVLNCILNYFLISSRGLYGAAVASMLTYLYTFIAVQIASMKTMKMPWFSAFRKNAQQNI